MRSYTFSKLFIACILTLPVFNAYASNCNTCTMPTLAGAFPPKLCKILKSNNFNTGSNRLLLHGPGGNGKTSIPEIIAAFHCTEFKQVSAAQIMSRYVSQSAANMRNIFTNEGFQKTNLVFTEKSDLPVVRRIIFIDEVDLIASVNTSEFRSEHEATKKEFWLLLDMFKKMEIEKTEKGKDKGPFFIICATNRYDLLDPNFVSRFGGNVIEISNPDPVARKEALKAFCANQLAGADNFVDDWAQRTEGFSMRDLKNFVEAVRERDLGNSHKYDTAIVDEEMQVIRNKVEAQKKLAEEKSNADLDAEHRKLSIEQMKQAKEDRKKDDKSRAIGQIAVKTGAVLAAGGGGYAAGAALHTAALTVAKTSVFAGPAGHVMLPIAGTMFAAALVLDAMHNAGDTSEDDKSKKS